MTATGNTSVLVNGLTNNITPAGTVSGVLLSGHAPAGSNGSTGIIISDGGDGSAGTAGYGLSLNYTGGGLVHRLLHGDVAL